MNKNEYISQIQALKPFIGTWSTSIEQNSKSGFVMGYFFNSDTNNYNVFINDERGKQKIRLSTKNELEALAKLLDMIEFEVESNQ